MINIKKLIFKILIVTLLIGIYSFLAYKEINYIRNHNTTKINEYLKSELEDYDVTINDESIDDTSLNNDNEKAYNNLIKLLSVNKLSSTSIEDKIK